MTSNIFGIGYEGVTLDEFIQTLKNREATILVDVRLNPISRKKGFSKTKLSEALGQHGIRYVHLRELGNPKENRDGFWDTYTPAWEAARENYRFMLDSEAAREALTYIEELARVEPAVGLMCFERAECNCHRDVILQRIKQQELALV
ncbi:DUF488 domain-containing protein [Rothia aeria]|jgi:hypothetical protein